MKNSSIQSLLCLSLALITALPSPGPIHAQEPTSPEKLSPAKATELLKAEEGKWDVAVTFTLRPNAKPITSHATAVAHLTLDGQYLEQRIDGTFGPEMGNKSWSSQSYTGFDASSGQFEVVRMASSETPMLILRGKANSQQNYEVAGEYSMMGAKATERDVIRHEGEDKFVVESWMSFGGSPEFKGVEMVFTRSKPAATESPLKLGNFSVSLLVKDLKTSKVFYEKLGFRSIAGDNKRYSIMQNDDSTIGLFEGKIESNILTYNPGWNRKSETLPEFDDVRAIQASLKSKGIEIKVKAEENATGPASIMLVDPDGNQILIDQHVPKAK